MIKFKISKEIYFPETSEIYIGNVCVEIALSAIKPAKYNE